LTYSANACLYSDFLFSSKLGSHTLYDVEYTTGRFNLFQRYKASHHVNKSCGRISHSLICLTEWGAEIIIFDLFFNILNVEKF
jgi:hypothetical protein